ncbi:MAG: hypothetical protein WD928_11555 [Gammaproteobacteria bacterium]
MVSATTAKVLRARRMLRRSLVGAALVMWGVSTLADDAPMQAPAAPQPVAERVQVLAARIVVRAAPQREARALAEVERGRQLPVLAREGDWFRVRYGTTPRAVGWVLRERGAYDQATVELLDGVAPSLMPALDAALPESSPLGVARPGGSTVRAPVLPLIDPSQVSPPAPNLPRESVPLPDRWRIMQALGFGFPWFDPYNQNVLKGDLPLTRFGPDIFFNGIAVSDTLFEYRTLPNPVPQAVSFRPGANDIFGRRQQHVVATTLLAGFSVVRGNTTYRPPDWEFRILSAFNYNHARASEAGVLRIDPTRGRGRQDEFVGIQEFFYDYHLRNVSDRYDFDSIRVGIQPFTSDFRGFLFLDQALGVRLFGNRLNNRLQYNLAWFRRLEKDTNSGLNTIFKTPRHDDTYLANVYFQDFPILGFTVQGTVLHNRNRETRDHYDTNGFLVRPALVGDVQPHAYYVTYFGFSGDGHLFWLWDRLRLNLSTSTYLALGRDDRHPIAGRAQRIFAGFHASEISRDFDWIRLRANLLFASGDSDPFDGDANGFDAIFEAPQFAGADTAYFIRQGIPLIGGGAVAFSGRNGILPSLRSSREQGQSNFINPGLQLYGVGADFDVLPQLRVTVNASYLRFMNTTVLGVLRQERDPHREIGTDLAIGLQFRPFQNQNVVLNASGSMLVPGRGLRDLYGPDQGPLYSTFANAILAF